MTNKLIIPLFVLWNGFVSCLRTYTAAEMQQLIHKVPNHQLYDWKVGRSKSGPGAIQYLIGTEKANHKAA